MLLQQLRLEKYDYVIDLHHNLRTFRLKSDLRVKSFSFNKLNIQKWFFTKLKWNFLPDEHIVDRYLKTVKQFGVSNDGDGLDYFLPKNEKLQQMDIPISHRMGYVGFAIGALHNTKKLPLAKMKELCNQIKYPIILLGGKEDAEIGELVAAVDSIKIFNACGKFSLNESAVLVQNSKLIIAHDTGLMHIAAALKKPIISIWGNTVPEFGMKPYYGNFNIQNTIVEVHGLKCRPCSKIGHQQCPKSHFNCMNQQNISEIATSVMNILGNANNTN